MARVNTIGKDITTAGTAERASATDLWVSWCIVEFKSGNSGSTGYRGFSSSVDNTYPQITADKPFSWAISMQNLNLYDLWLDVATNGDGFWISYGVAQSEVPADQA